MFEEISARISLLLVLALTAFPAAKYIFDYVTKSPRYHDITKPREDLSWRSRIKLARYVALLISLLALAIFSFSPAAEKFTRSAAFLPTVLILIGGFAIYSVGVGLSKGSITPLIKGISAKYQRHEHPKRFWASLSWNGALGAICGWAAFATITGMGEDRCYDRQDRYTPNEEVKACTVLLADNEITAEERADILALRGQAYHLSGEYQSAFKDYVRAIDLDPKDSYSLYNRALINEHFGRMEDAIADYDLSLKLRPDNYEAYLHRGVLLADSGKYDQAISDFDAARQFGGGDEWPIVYRGMAHAAKNKRKLAEQDFATVRRINPNNAFLLRGEAFFHMQDGNYGDAVQKLTRALRNDPNDLATLKMRAETYWQLGEEAKSRSDEDRIWELSDPDLHGR